MVQFIFIGNDHVGYEILYCGGFFVLFCTSKSMSEALTFASINPKYSIPLLDRFTLIIHKNCISRTSEERQ